MEGNQLEFDANEEKLGLLLTTSTPSNSSIQDEDDSGNVEDAVAVKKTGGMLSAIFNLSNGLIGAGTLSFPYTVFCAGMVLEGIIGIIVIVLTLLTLNILVAAGLKKKGEKGFRSYQECVSYYLGPFWKMVCELIILFYTTCLLCTYFVVISEFIKPLLDYYVPNGFFLTNSKMIISIFAIIVIFPTVLLREIKKLGFTSFVGELLVMSYFLAIAGLAYFTVFIFVNAIVTFTRSGLGPGVNVKTIVIQTDPYPGTNYPLLFMSIPILTFAYQSHAILFPISYELANKNFTIVKLNVIILISVSIVTTIYFCNAYMGFLTFGSDVQDNVLNNFSGGNVLANISRFFLGVSITFSFPLMNYASRLTLLTLLFKKTKKLSTASFIVIQSVYFLIVLAIALFVPNISVGFGFIGSIASSSLMFLFPALLLIKMSKDLSMIKQVFAMAFGVCLILLVVFICASGCTASVFRLIQSIK